LTLFNKFNKNNYTAFDDLIGIFDKACKLLSCNIVILNIDLKPGSSKHKKAFLASKNYY
jgi:hypothetical protein